jgi:hypothetical protein
LKGVSNNIFLVSYKVCFIGQSFGSKYEVALHIKTEEVLLIVLIVHELQEQALSWFTPYFSTDIQIVYMVETMVCIL